MAGKQVITEAHVRTAYSSGRKTLRVPIGAIVTPLARDTARDLGIALHAEPAQMPAVRTPSKQRTDPFSAGRLALGADHGGFRMKREVKAFVEDLGWTVVDVGTTSEDTCDYPTYAFAVGRSVVSNDCSLGIMIDGAGIGSAMVCNKIPGIRAACAYNEFTARNARAHNNANVLTLGSRTLGIEVVKAIIRVFLDTQFEGGRHSRRVDKITDVELRYSTREGGR
jgi:ribose 5-phosphate isomerase B